MAPRRKIKGGHAAAPPVSSTTVLAAHAAPSRPLEVNEEELAQALRLSLEQAEQERRFRELEAQASELSLVTAATERAEAEAIELALQASASASASHEAAGTCAAGPAPFEAAIPVQMVLKVSHGQDTRRLRATWGAASTASEVLHAIDSTIVEGFGLALGHGPQGFCLKYTDDDGDLCTLAESTVLDMLSLQGSKGTENLRLHLMIPQYQTSAEAAAPEAFSLATPPTSPRADSPVQAQAVAMSTACAEETREVLEGACSTADEAAGDGTEDELAAWLAV